MMKILFTFYICIISTTLLAQKKTSKEASNYLNEYISIVKSNSMRRDSIDWIQFEQLIFEEAIGSQNTKETYGAIKKGLEFINDGHSFFMTPEETQEWKNGNQEDSITSIPGPIPYGELIENVGYINLPWFHSGNDKSCQLFADTLQSIIATLDTNDLKGWIIDLRDNLGGNSWPMQAGISPLYDVEYVGANIYPDKRQEKWIIKNGEVIDADTITGKVSKPYKLKNKNLPIAILINGSTASSGEIVLVSFIGAKNTKTFGTPTRGSTTCNELFPFVDGAQLLLTTSVYADRNGFSYQGPIPPDVYVDNSKLLPSFYTIMKKAINWINNY